MTGTASSTEILTESHYYPFGMNMNYDWTNNSALTADTKYQYNGKEMNDDFRLGWNDYGFRWYDAAVCRFPNPDPIIEKFAYLTPYNYASNEPVAHIDLWGLQGSYYSSNPMYYLVAPVGAAIEQAANWIDKTFSWTTSVAINNRVGDMMIINELCFFMLLIYGE